MFAKCTISQEMQDFLKNYEISQENVGKWSVFFETIGFSMLI